MKTRIREIREREGMTRRQLADRAGLSYPALTKWETNMTEIGLDKAIAVARALHCTVSDLVENPPRRHGDFSRLACRWDDMEKAGASPLADVSTVTDDEWTLVRGYRVASELARRTMMLIARGFLDGLGEVGGDG